MPNDTKARIESELEVKAYLQNLKYALNNGAKYPFRQDGLSMKKEQNNTPTSIQLILYFPMRILLKL